MEDGVKTGTKPKKSGFLMGQSSAFTREIWILLKIERTDPKSEALSPNQPLEGRKIPSLQFPTSLSSFQLYCAVSNIIVFLQQSVQEQ